MGIRSFIRALFGAPEPLLLDKKVFPMDEKAFQEFKDILDRPPAPTPALKRLLKPPAESLQDLIRHEGQPSDLVAEYGARYEAAIAAKRKKAKRKSAKKKPKPKAKRGKGKR